MNTKPFTVYVIQGRNPRDYSDCQAVLAAVPARLEMVPFLKDQDDIIGRTQDADALIVSSSPITRRVMSALRQLKVVVRTGVGYDVIDVPAATELGIVVVNIPDLWVREVANHALALLLAWNRKIITLNQEVKSGVWQSRVPGSSTGSLHGETVGIVGFGNIGRAFARRVSALETQVIAYDPYVDDAQFAALGVERVRSLGELAARADYVSVHTLLNAETRHLIDEVFLRQMKPTACLINTSRGPVVDEQALIRALQQGWIAGAALDVREPEPPAPDSPLCQMDNVILTPHAAYYSTPAVAQVPRRCGEEVARALTGQRPLHVVNPEVYAAVRQPIPHRDHEASARRRIRVVVPHGIAGRANEGCALLFATLSLSRCPLPAEKSEGGRACSGGRAALTPALSRRGEGTSPGTMMQHADGQP